MIGIVVPVHNEEQSLRACLCAINRAKDHPELNGEGVRVVVVLDSCTDGSAEVAAQCGVQCITIDHRNVGLARDQGSARLLALNATWLAYTDADTIVSPNWLVAQRRLRAEAVCGTVGVNWQSGGTRLRSQYENSYTDREGHSHIHGANLGISARAYRRSGGFKSLKAREDVALVHQLVRVGISVAWSAQPRVLTSARLRGRLAGGFADHLRRLANAECSSPLRVTQGNGAFARS